MRITIVGGGKVGYTIAENLANEKHDITVVEAKASVIEKINEELDVLCIKGNGASVAVLKEAGVQKTDIFIATTSRDEVNMIACLTAKSLGAKYTIARIRDFDYTDEIDLLTHELKIDLAINPESATAASISRLMRFPDAADVETFYHGRIELVGFRAHDDDFFTERSLGAVGERLTNEPILFCAVEHKGITSIPNGSTVIHSGDKVYMIGATENISKFFAKIGRNTRKVKNVFIIGGGRVATYLSKQLIKAGTDVKIIEQNYDTCVSLTEMLPSAIIISGDGTDQNLLDLESVSKYDCFLSLTGRDEDNIIAALYAKQQGAKNAIAKVNRQNYLRIVDSLEIDSIVSPKLITAYGIIRTVRGMLNSHGSQMLSLYKIAGGEAEAMEFVVSRSPKHLGTPLKDISMKPGVLLALIIRNGVPIIPEGMDCIKAGDNIIVVSKGHQILDINDIYDD